MTTDNKEVQDLPAQAEKKESTESQVYELAYHILPTLGEENVATELLNLKNFLENIDTSIISDEYPVLMDLAYTMEKSIANKKNKFDKGYFGWIKFDVAVGDISKVKEYVEKNDNILRYLIVKTVKENTLASKKKNMKRRVVRKNDGPKEEINKEEVDAKIDELVTG